MTIIPPAQIDAPTLNKTLRATFDSGRTRPLAWREAQLAGLRRMMEEGEAELRRGAAAPTSVARRWRPSPPTSATPSRSSGTWPSTSSSWVKPTKVRMPATVAPGQGLDRARAARRGAGDRAVELPDPAARSSRSAPRWRPATACWPSRPSWRRPAPRRWRGSCRGTSTPRRVDRRRGRRRRDHRAARRAVGPHLLHRLHRRRPDRGRGRRQAPHAHRPRARRQVARPTCTQRRPRRGRAPHRVGQVPQRRSDLHRARLRARRPRGEGRAGRQARQPDRATSTAPTRRRARASAAS